MRTLASIVVVSLLLGLPAASQAAGPAPGVAATRDVKVPRPWVALHLLGYQTDADLEALAQQLPALAARGVNVLILEVDYAFEFKSHPELRRPEKPITRRGARQFVEACRKHGIAVIPQFQSFGHQSWEKNTGPLLTVYPELDLTPGAFPGNEGIYCREWDPLNPRVNQIAFALIDEIIDAFDADAVHVGLDEIFLVGHDASPSTKNKDPAEVFAKAVNDLHAHIVKERGRTMLMWGDRLIDAERLRLRRVGVVEEQHLAGDLHDPEGHRHLRLALREARRLPVGRHVPRQGVPGAAHQLEGRRGKPEVHRAVIGPREAGRARPPVHDLVEAAESRRVAAPRRERQPGAAADRGRGPLIRRSSF